jgi:hypothetical protein
MVLMCDSDIFNGFDNILGYSSRTITNNKIILSADLQSIADLVTGALEIILIYP